jgi:hypothetical protein
VSLLCLPIAQRQVQAEGRRRAFGLYGDQSVFESEATRRSFRPITAGANTKSRDDANLKMTATTLQWTSKTMDADHDVLFVILTSHGSICDVERLAVDIAARAA